MNTRQIIVIFCLFAVFFSALSIASASEDVDNITVSVANDENTIEVANDDNEVLQDSPATFTELDSEIQSVPQDGNLTLVKDYKYSDNSNQAILISNDMTIDGQGHTLDASNEVSVFKIKTNTHVVFNNITFINGKGFNGGAIELTPGSSVEIINCRFINNTATNYGGAIYNVAYGASLTSTITDSIFENNTALNGGAIYLLEDNAKIDGATFTGNNAEKDGAALYVAGDGCNLANSTFTDNVAGDDGPAVYWEGSNGIIYNISCSNNRGTSNGTSSSRGGSICLTGSNVTVKKSSFKNSFAGFDGGALFITGNDVNVIDTLFDNCTARDEHGGALYVIGNNTNIVSCGFENCNANLSGGVIYVDGNGAVINHATFTGNGANLDGGALFVAGNNCILSDSTFTDNTAGDDGGAIYWQGDDGIISNITCTNNKGISGIDPIDQTQSNSKGGTICLTGSNVTIEKSSFTQSSAVVDGGALFITGNDVNVIDTEFDDCTSADSNGGALYIIGNNTNILNCDFENCNANLSGGVIYVEGDGAVIEHASVKSSAANLDGAAIYVAGDDCVLANSTFTDNTAGDDGGAIYWQGDNGLIYNITCTNNKGISGIDPTDNTQSNSKGGTICLTGSNVTIDQSTFTQSSAVVDGGALFITGNDVNVLNSEFKDCTSTNSSGGALYIIGNSTDVINCIFDDCDANKASGNLPKGGAIYIEGHNGNISDSIFRNTEALIGGAIFIAGDNTTVDNSAFSLNDASGATSEDGGAGGAIYIDGNRATISNSDFAFGTTVRYGGAISIWGPNAVIVNDTFEDCTSNEFQGGAIFISGVNATISLSNFSRDRTVNQFTRGGAIGVQGDNANILECNFDECDSYFGGSIYVSGTNAVIKHSAFDDSDAHEGGAIYIDGTYTTVYRSNFTGDRADMYGGAIYLSGIKANISESNFIDCTVDYYHGGAIYVTGEDAIIEKSNFTSCKAKSKVARGGAIDAEGPRAVISDSNFDSCEAVDGGSIYVEGNYVTIETSNFNSSTATKGGSIYLSSWGATVKQSNITGSTARESGGAMYVAGGGANIAEDSFEDCLAKGKSSTNGGGAIYVWGPDTHISTSGFNNNKVENVNAKGGTIYISGNRTYIESSDFNKSYAGYGGIIYIEGEKTIINSSTFANSSSKYYGGAISVNGHNTTIEWSEFENITAGSHGGAIYIDGEDTNILQSSFDGCTVDKSHNGGAIYIADVRTTVAYSNFTHSYAGVGGAVYISGENTTFSYCNLDNNTASSTAGAVYIAGTNTVLSNCNLDNNSAVIAGAVKVTGDNTLLSDCNFTYNKASGNTRNSNGGALDIGGENASVRYSWFDHNEAMACGGAINWQGGHGDDSIIGTTFTNNVCYGTDKGGGAIYWDVGDKIASGGLILDSIFINNTAAGRHGGAIDWFRAKDSKFDNCLFINNRANKDGGALYTGDQGGNSLNLTITNSQFYNNTAGLYGGAIANQMGSTNVVNNVFDGNKAGASGGTILMKEGVADNSIIDHCYIYNSYCERADGWGEGGGAILIGGSDDNITISNCYIVNATANKTHGGAIAVKSPYSSLINVTIENSSTNDGEGGAIFWSGGYGTLNNVTIVNSSSNSDYKNKNADGGAIYLSGSNCNLNVITISGSSSNIDDKTSGKTANGGAIYVSGASNTLTNITIDDSSALSVKMNADGGAIYWIGSSGTLINATISNTLANGRGGAIYWSGGSATVENISIEYSRTNVVDSSNSADGGAIYATGIDTLKNVYIVDSIASRDSGNILGGAIYFTGHNINNVTVIASRASTDEGESFGGAVYWKRSGSGNSNLYDSSFTRNTADNGGAVYTVGTTYIWNTSFTGNVALNGGALYGTGGDNILSNASFIYNSAENGGAVFTYNIQIRITDSDFEFNTAVKKGGAIYHNNINLNQRNTEITNTRLTNNTAFQGSAIYGTRLKNFYLKNSVLLDNQANSMAFIDKVIGVDENGNNYTSAIFTGYDNLLNSIWQDANLAISCSNVTYWDVGGIVVTNSAPVQTNQEHNINVTVYMFDKKGTLIGQSDLVTDANGKVKYIFDGQNGETYNFAYEHKTDRYYTYLRDTYSNSTIVEVYVNNISYGENASIRIDLIDSAWGSISGNVTVVLNDTNHTTFIVEVTNVTAIIDNISGLAVGHYNVTASFAGNETVLGAFNWADFYVRPVVDLHVLKDVNVTGDYVNVTDYIKYTVTVTNHGPNLATDVYVIERLSEYLKLTNSYTNNHGFYNLTNGTWYIGNLDVDEVANLTIIAQVIHKGPITNAVWVTGEGRDINLTNNNATARNLTAVPYVDLAIWKDVNVTGDIVRVLDYIRFNITVTNNGPCNATGVVVAEALDPHLALISYEATTGNGTYERGTWSIGNLTVGANETLTIIAQIIYSGNFTNVVTVSGYENETNYTNNRDAIRNLTAVANVDLKITKKVNITTGVVNVTDKIKFTITVTNDGPCNASGVYVSEPFDYVHLKMISNSTTNGTFDGSTWVIGDLNKGVVYNLTIIAEVIKSGNITNAVVITGNVKDNDTNLSNNKDSIDNITAYDIVDLQITKEVDVTSDTVNVTDKITFTITVFNDGPCDATNVNVSEKLSPLLRLISNSTYCGHYDDDGVWYIGSLANQSTVVLVLYCEVISNGTFTNVVSVNSTEIDTNMSNNIDSIKNITALPLVDLQITKQFNTSNVVNVSDVIKFTITVTNNGPCNATLVNVTEILTPHLKLLSENSTKGFYNSTGGYWYIGSLTNRSSAVLNLTCEVVKSGSVENFVSVTGHENDTNPFNNHDDVAITALPIIDLAIVKKVNVTGKVNVTDRIQFNITVSNSGPSNATGVYVSELLDSHLRIISNTTTIGKYNDNTWNIGNLAAGEIHNLTIIAEVISAGNIANTVTVTGYENDTNMSNNRDSIDNITALPVVDVQVTKTVDVQSNQINVGDFLIFTIRVNNAGPCDATYVNVTEKLSPHLSLLYMYNSTGRYDKDEGIWYIGDLRKNAGGSLILVCEAVSAGNISNAVVATSKENDTNMSNNRDSIDNITAVPVLDLTITKKSNITSGIVNETDWIEFTVTVYNRGPCDATYVNVSEKLNPAFRLISSNPSVGKYNATAGIWTIGTLQNRTGANLKLICEVADHGYFENEVNVSSRENDINMYNNWDKIAIISNAYVDVNIHKKANASGDVEVMDIIRFDLTVGNDGPSNATGVYVSEILDPHLELISYNATTGDGSYAQGTWTIGSLPKGATAKMTIVARIAYSGIISNDVTVYSYENDTDYSNNHDNITELNASAHVDLGIIKKVNVSGKVNVTDLIEFTVSVYNKGPCNATGVYVSELLDSHLIIISNTTTVGKYVDNTWNIGNLDVGAVHNLTIIAEVISAGNIANAVTVTGYDNDSDLSNNNASIENITALPIVDLEITKDVNVTERYVNVSDVLKFTLTVTNNGPCDATYVNVTEVIDSHLNVMSANPTAGVYDGRTWRIGDLASQATATLTIIANVTSVGTISNAVNVTSRENDTNRSNNYDSIDNITALPLTDLVISKISNISSGIVNESDKVEFTVTVYNRGPCDATWVNVTEKLDSAFRLISAKPGIGTYNKTTGIWTIGDLKNKTGTSLKLICEVVNHGYFENEVNVTGYENESNYNNNRDKTAIISNAVVDVSIHKDSNASGDVEVMDIIRFEITVRNDGPSNATGVYVSEILDPHLELISYEATTGNKSYGQGTWTIGSLPKGETAKLTIISRIVYSGNISNDVTVYSYEKDSNYSNNHDNISELCASAHVDLGIIKKVNVSGKVNVTDLIEFTVSVYNKGPCNATGVYVSELIDSHLRIISNTTTAGKYVDNTWNIGNLDVGAVHNLTIIAEVISAGNIANAVTVTGYDNDSDLSNNNASIENITALPIVDLEITKDVNVTGKYVNVSDVLKFTVTVINNGPCDATYVNVTEIIDSHLNVISASPSAGVYDGRTWTVGNLASHARAVLTIIANVTSVGTISNAVNVTGYENDTDKSNNNDSIDNLTALPVVDVAITKKVNVTGKANVTDKIEYTITVVNNGPCDATDVNVTEKISPYLEMLSAITKKGYYNKTAGYWYIGNLARQATAVLTITCEVIRPGNVENIVAVTSYENDTDYSNNHDNADFKALAIVDLGIVKKVNVTGKVNVTDRIEFTLTVYNRGPCNATDVYVDERLNPHLKIISNKTTIGRYDGARWIIGNLNEGEVHNLTIIAEVISAGNITNAVTITGHENDTDRSNNNDSIENITALPIVDLQITKTVDVRSGKINVSDYISFAIRVTNNGSCDATGVKVTEVLSSHLRLDYNVTSLGSYDVRTGIWDIGDLKSKASCSLLLVCEAISAGNISNAVIVSSNENDTDKSNNNDSIDNIIALPLTDLTVTKKSNISSGIVNVTDKVEFTITVTNNGPCDATWVNVTEKLNPAFRLISAKPDAGTYNKNTGIWNIGDLKNRTGAELKLICEVIDHGYLENEVNVTGYENESNYDNNRDKIAIIALPIVDVSIHKQSNASGNVEVMDIIRFDVTVRNDGPSKATGVYVSEILDPHLQLVSYEATTGDGTYDKGTWTIGNLTKGATAKLSIVARIVYSGNITNDVTVYSYENDTDYSNNYDNITALNAFAHVDLGIVKKVNVTGKVNVTDLIEFTVSVYNNGPCNASGVYVVESLNEHLRIVSNQTTAGEYDGYTWKIGNLDVGAVHNLTIIAEVISAGNITNAVTVTGYDDDSNLSNNNASIENITALPIVDLEITKEVNVTAGVVNVSDLIKFTITVVNNGPCDASGVYVGEVLDRHLALISYNASAGHYDKFTWTIGNLASKANATLTIIANVTSVGIISNVVDVTSYENDTDKSNNNDSIDNITALPVVDLRVNKTVNATKVNVTDYIRYTISVVNDGPCNATYVNVTEHLSPLVRLVKAETDTGTYDESLNIWHIGDLPVNTPVVLTLTVQIIANGTVENTATVTGYENDTDKSNNNASSDNVTALPIVDVSIVKTSNVTGDIEVTDYVEFTIVVTNHGPSNATGVYVSEMLNPCLKLVSYDATAGVYDGFTWKNFDLNNGSSETLKIVARVVYSGNITNDVTAYSYENDTDYTNNHDNITALNAFAHVDLGIVKKVNVTGKVNVSDLIEFTVSVYNNGPCNATGVYVKEVLDEALEIVSNTTTIGEYDGYTWKIGNLDKGAVHNLTIVARVISIGNITNAVTVTGYDNDSDLSNNNASIENITALPIVDLQIAKEVNVTGGLVNITDVIRFTIKVVNNGPCDASGVYVGEVLDRHLSMISYNATVGDYDGFTWTIGNLASKANATLTIDANVTSLGTISNRVNVTGIENDTDKSNNNASIDNLTALPIVDLSINKTADRTVVNVTDYIKYTICVVNNGPSTATDINVTEHLSPFVKLTDAKADIGTYDNLTNIWHIDELIKGVPVTLELTVQVIANGTIENSADVVSRENDTDRKNNNASSDNVTALPIVDLRVNKTVDKTVVNVTDYIKYTICVVNAGPCNATYVNVTEKLSPFVKVVKAETAAGSYDESLNIWHIGDLSPNNPAVLTLTVQVIANGTIENSVYVESRENDTDKQNNNASSDNVTALPIVDLRITKTVNTTKTNVTDCIKYTITVANKGPSNATDVVVVDKLDSHLKFVSFDASRTGITYDNATGECVVGNLNAGEEIVLTVVARILSVGTITNTANVTSHENDTDKQNNNASSDNVTALPIVDIEITKKVNATLVNVTDLIEFTITVVNNGPCNATGVNVTDKLSRLLEFVSFDASRAGITYDTLTGTSTIGNLDAGESVVLTIAARVISAGTVENVAFAKSNENDTDSDNNNGSSDNVTALPIVDVEITKTVNATLVNVTDFIEFTITVVNNGPCNATGVNVTDKLSKLLEFVSFDASRTGITYDTLTGTSTVGNLDAGETVILTIVAEVISNGTIENVAVVKSNENDTDTDNNKAGSDNVTALPIVDVKVSKTVSVNTAKIGDDFTYIIIVYNNGPSDATDVNVLEKLSDYVTLVQYNASKGNYDVDSSSWYIGKLAKDETSTLTLVVKVISNGTVENVVYVTSHENDTNLTNNYYPCENVTVLKFDTPMHIDVYDITYGDDEIVTVTLPDGATGTVNITVGDRTYADLAINKGKVILPVIDLAGGDYTAAVYYGGDGIYVANSTSAGFNVARVVPIITIEVEDIWVGEVEVINITVNAPGTVNVTVYGITVTIPLDNGVVTTDVLAAVKNSYLGNATWNMVNLPVGAYPAFTIYPGNENYTSVNTSDLFHVRDIPTNVNVTVRDIHVGEDAVINIEVGPEGVTGNVIVTVDGDEYIVALKNGKARLVVPDLTAGEKEVYVVYNGTVLYRPSENETAFNVLKLKPPVSVEAPEITVGEDGVITVTVPEDATGTITIEIEGKRYTAEIEDGEAVFFVPGLKVGVHDIAAYYSGDDKYLPANATGTIKVNPLEENKTDNRTHEKYHGSGICLENYPTGNPILVLFVIILAVGSAKSRKFKR